MITWKIPHYKFGEIKKIQSKEIGRFDCFFVETSNLENIDDNEVFLNINGSLIF